MSLADLTDLDNFAHGFPHELFAAHRREAPVYWHSATEHTPDGEDFWSVATHAETHAVLQDPSTISSVTGGARRYGGTLLQDLAVVGQVLNMMDDPRHAEIHLTRTPNPHLGFGYGIHYCLGANLVRLELWVLFEESLARFESAWLVRPVEWTRSNRHTGIRHLVVELA